ncbi:MAG: DUF4385 family protein [Terracoccus sp.]
MRTPSRARFDECLAEGDLVGADLARTFLQMGFTRAGQDLQDSIGCRGAGQRVHDAA